MNILVHILESAIEVLGKKVLKIKIKDSLCRFEKQ